MIAPGGIRLQVQHLAGPHGGRPEPREPGYNGSQPAFKGTQPGKVGCRLSRLISATFEHLADAALRCRNGFGQPFVEPRGEAPERFVQPAQCRPPQAFHVLQDKAGDFFFQHTPEILLPYGARQHAPQQASG